MYDAAPDLTSLVIEGFEEKPASGFVALDKLMARHQPDPRRLWNRSGAD